MDVDEPSMTEDQAMLDALEELTSAIEAVSASPMNASLHEHHIQVSQNANMDDQVLVARGMMVQSLACTDGTH